MNDKIMFQTYCEVCEHREVCKYYSNGVCGEVLLQLEQVAPLIPEPFIIVTGCNHYKFSAG